MTSTRTLLRGANPVPEVRTVALTPRARGELYALAPSTARGLTATPHRRRGGLALTVTAAVAVVAFAALVLPMILRGAIQSSSTTVGDYPYYGTTAELEGAADLIVRGTITSMADADDFSTVATVDVIASAKGSIAPGSTIDVRYSSGGDPGDRTDLVVGGEYVILLDDLADLEGDWPPTPVNANQGLYTVADGHAVAAPGNPVPLAPTTLGALGLS